MDTPTKEAQEMLKGGSEPIKPVPYTEEEKTYRGMLIRQLCADRDEREKSHPEFDDMPYSLHYDANKRADLAYNPPTKNKRDARIVSGTTREKDNMLLSTLLSFNFEPTITAFDEDDAIIPLLGEGVEDMVRKSRHIEDYDAKRADVYREYVVQGDVFVREYWNEIYTPDVEGEWKPGDPISSASFSKKGTKRCFARAETKKIQGTKVYLGNIKEEYLWNQPRITTYEVVPRHIAEAVFGKWDRWEFVPKTVDNTTFPENNAGVYEKDWSWSLTNVPDGHVGILITEDKFRNRYMIMLNGVMMCPIDMPLTKVSPSGEYTISQGKFESIPNFAYSKSSPSKTKVEQQTADEFLRLMVLKTQQSFEPPMGNRSGQAVRRDVLMPAKITHNIKEGQLFPLIDANGVNAAEFSMYELLKRQIEEKTVNKAYSGAQRTDDPTATQVIQEKQQQMLKLALAIDGVINLERQMTWKRIYTIMTQWTKPVAQEVDDMREAIVDRYMQFTLSGELNSGEKGLKIYRMTTDKFPSPREQQQEEFQLQEKYNQPVRLFYTDPNILQSLKAVWYIQIVPTEKNNDELSKAVFVKNIQEAAAIFGPQSLNFEYLKQRWANKSGESYDKMFASNAMAMVQQNQQEQGGGMQPAKPGVDSANKMTLKNLTLN